MNNKIMKKLLEKLKENKSPKKNVYIEINDFLIKIYPNIMKINNCIILNDDENLKLDKKYLIKTYGSLSAFEDFKNHIHIFDIINCSVMQTLKFGMILKDIIKNKLKMQFPKDNFIIILTCDGKEKINTILRFHKYRKNDPKIYYENDIEKYKTGVYLEKI